MGIKKKLKKLIQGSIIERKFEGRETSAKSDALKEYAIWGEQSAYLTRPTVKEVKKMSSEFLINQIKDEVVSMNRRLSGKEFSLNAQVGEDGDEWQDWLVDKELDHDLKFQKLPIMK